MMCQVINIVLFDISINYYFVTANEVIIIIISN
jgi:hypothetical protein